MNSLGIFIYSLTEFYESVTLTIYTPVACI